MTNNKMPKVGERYRVASYPHKEKIVINAADLIYFDDGSQIIPEYFWNVFEEIPNNSQKPQIIDELHISGRGLCFVVKKDREWKIGDTIEKDGKEYVVTGIDAGRENLGLIVRENLQKPSEVQVKKSVLSDEVREAMEGLRKEMPPKHMANVWNMLSQKAQELLNLPESMDKSNIPEKGDCGIVEDATEEIFIQAFLGDLIEYEGKKYQCIVGQTYYLPDQALHAWEEKDWSGAIFKHKKVKKFGKNQPEEEKKISAFGADNCYCNRLNKKDADTILSCEPCVTKAINDAMEEEKKSEEEPIVYKKTSGWKPVPSGIKLGTPEFEEWYDRQFKMNADSVKEMGTFKEEKVMRIDAKNFKPEDLVVKTEPCECGKFSKNCIHNCQGKPKCIWKDSIIDLLYGSALSPEQIHIFEMILEFGENLEQRIKKLEEKNAK